MLLTLVAAWAAESGPRPLGPGAVLATTGPTPEAIFRFVRDQTSPELGGHSLQSPAKVLASGRGNSAERARLLGELLVLAGHPVRYQEGDLPEAAARTLIETALPAASQGRAWPAPVKRARPAEDPALAAAVRRHLWVQVLDGGHWLDLDPSFPSARPGERFAEEGSPFYRFGPSRLARVELSLEADRVSAPGGFVELAWWDGPLDALAGRAVGLRVFPLVRGVAGNEGALDSARRRPAPLEGTDEPAAAEPGETSWRAELCLDSEVIASGEAALAGAGDGAVDPLRSLRLRVRTVLAEGEALEDEWVLVQRDRERPLPALYPRHVLLFTAGRVARDRVDELLAARPLAERGALRARIDRLRSDLGAGPRPLGPLLDEALDLEDAVGTQAGHLLTLGFAALSDEVAEDLARRLGVHAYYDEPRLLVASFVSDTAGRVEISLDLRRDRRRAVARTGEPEGMARAYQHARGVIESVLGGRVVGLGTGAAAVTPAGLTRAAREAGIPVRLYPAREQAALASLALPDPVRERLGATLARGQVVALPGRPVGIAGRDRWGWWQVDPLTLDTVGVLEGGLRQAAAERSVIGAGGVSGDEMAAVIGAIAGATESQWVLSALVLEYGALTEEVLREAQVDLEQGAEYLCEDEPLEAKSAASRETSSAPPETEGCYEHEVAVEAQVTGGPVNRMDRGWCEAFRRGLRCASMTVLSACLSGP